MFVPFFNADAMRGLAMRSMVLQHLRDGDGLALVFDDFLVDAAFESIERVVNFHLQRKARIKIGRTDHEARIECDTERPLHQ
ncbi:MAG: hypothetical protein WBV39_14105 [Rudaea sp.]